MSPGGAAAPRQAASASPPGRAPVHALALLQVRERDDDLVEVREHRVRVREQRSRHNGGGGRTLNGAMDMLLLSAMCTGILIPISIALFFSFSRLWRTPIFILNVFALALGFAYGGLTINYPVSARRNDSSF